MTLMSFGRTTPIQMNLLALVGYEFAQRDMQPARTPNARRRTMMAGLHALRKATEADFGYDPAAWREFLIESGDVFGYTHPFAFDYVDRAVRTAMDDADVIATLESLAAT